VDYYYPNTRIFINKLDIRDGEELLNIQRKVSAYRISQLEKNPIKGNLDFEHLKNIHKHIFQDIYDWAGKTREVDIYKGLKQFTDVALIEKQINSLFEELKNDEYLIPDYGNDFFARQLSYYYNKINSCHPFRDGNGRAQREFITTLANVAGYELDIYNNKAKEDLMKASIEARHKNEYSLLDSVFESSISKISIQEQQKFINSISSDKYNEIMKVFQAVKYPKEFVELIPKHEEKIRGLNAEIEELRAQVKSLAKNNHVLSDALKDILVVGGHEEQVKGLKKGTENQSQARNKSAEKGSKNVHRPAPKKSHDR